MRNEYHVAVSGNDFAEGTLVHPFRTISKAAKVAESGDTVIVHEGEYREWVKPEHSGPAISTELHTKQPRERRLSSKALSEFKVGVV